jgi:hypothetical protein
MRMGLWVRRYVRLKLFESVLSVRMGLDLNVWELFLALLLDPWTSVIDTPFFCSINSTTPWT